MNRMNGTKFMAQEEFKEKLTEIDLEKEDYISGGVPLVVKDGKAYIDAGDSHTIVFGATGSKKTRLLGMPTVEILSGAGESFVITDPKGEIYDKTIESVRERGYQIFCMNLRDFKKGNTWNPLALPYDFYRNGEKGKAVEMVSELSGMIIGHEGVDPFWTDSAADVITGFMLILLESALRDECNIKSLVALWNQYLGAREKTLQSVEELFGKSLLIRGKLGTLYTSSERTVGSIEAVVSTGINKLIANEEFVEFLSQDGLEFDCVTDRKSALYLIIPDENTFTHFIASLFLKQLYEVLIKDAQKQPEHKLAVRMNYVVDEFANIPKIQNMDSMITAARSRNIRFCLIVQSKKQLKDKYGDMAAVICDNCINWVYLYSKDFELLKEISLLCGEVIYDNHMVMPLISEFELQHLNKEEGEALVLSGRNYPCIVNLADIDEYPIPKKRQMQRMNSEKGNKQPSVEADTWQPVNIFDLKDCNMEKKSGLNEKAYIYPLRRAMKDRKRKKKKEKDIWLVGTYNGMILANELVPKKDIETGAGILWISFSYYQDLEDTMELQWFMASPELEVQYTMELYFFNPGRAFMTMQELGSEHFTPVKRVIPQCLGEGE